jgi:FkbM family methyltransferase
MFVTERAGVRYVFADTSIPRQREWLEKNFAIWEPFTFEVFARAADPTKICIDIGAWIGLTGIWLSKHFDHVICVEGDRNSVESLHKNLVASSCSNCTIVAQPVSNEKKTVIFGPNVFLHDTTLNESTSQIKQGATKAEDYEIETVTFHEIVRPLDAGRIGFIKCDIEGGEEDILEDMLQFARQHSIKTYISFHISWWKNRDIRRFKALFDGLSLYDEHFNLVSDPVSYLEGNPMGSLFLNGLNPM